MAESTEVFGYDQIFVALKHESPFHLCEKESSFVLLKKTPVIVLETRTQKHGCCQQLVKNVCPRNTF